MKQSLQLRLGQHLTMTPQLQQAIRLLQLSTVELQQEIQEALETNPMLDTGEDEHENESASETTSLEAAAEQERNDGEESDRFQTDDIPQDLAVDSSWEDTFEVSTSYTSSSSSYNGDESPREFENRNAEEEGLHDHLEWQMRLSHFSDTDTIIAQAIIDAVDDDGYLSMPLEEIWEGLKGEEGDEEAIEVDFDEMEAVLHRIQTFDPPGVAARDLRESLTLQLRELPADVPWYNEAKTLLEHHFELLANRDYTTLGRRMKLNQDDLREVFKVIHGLNPRPGSQVASSTAEYIIPDVYVRKYQGEWRVDLNPDAVPKLSINSLYANMIQRANKSADNTYMQGQLQEARWLIKSLLSRNETLLKVARCIVDRQREFLEQGEEAMKALVLHDVAETVSMHESTISRITNKKYMHTPRGIFELKYFFSSHVSTNDGGECSSTAIRALIKKLVAAEEPRKPLSDSKIAKILADQGINVARRTVAKYRDAMAIPPSNERKRLA